MVMIRCIFAYDMCSATHWLLYSAFRCNSDDLVHVMGHVTYVSWATCSRATAMARFYVVLKKKKKKGPSHLNLVWFLGEFKLRSLLTSSLLPFLFEGFKHWISLLWPRLSFKVFDEISFCTSQGSLLAWSYVSFLYWAHAKPHDIACQNYLDQSVAYQ